MLLSVLMATGSNAEAIDLKGLLTQMIDRSQIAEFPEPAFVCKQASSYCRKSEKPGTPEWYATGDCSQFIRCEEVGDRREWVMADIDGPGAIVRWWITQYKYDGTIRVYLDGNEVPVLEGTGDEVVAGKSGKYVGAPLSERRAAGCNLYMPIPFAKHCKITYDGLNMQETKKFADNIYYNINYVQYPEGTDVKTFTLDDLKTNAKLIAKVQQELLEPARNVLPVKRTVEGAKETLTSGASISQEIEGVGAICSLKVKLAADDIEQAMRSTVITIDFDGKQHVWAPLGGFFGCGPGLNPHKGWWRQVEADGWMTCWWPMPFKESAKVTVTNHGDQDVSVELGDTGITQWTWTPRTMYFNSSWRGDDHIAVFGNNYVMGEEWNYATIRGRGVYVGDTMAVFNRPLEERNSWWGEGDEKIYVDGELFPSHFGTGTEDYYGYAWGTDAPFSAPFHAQPRGGANRGSGHTTNTRVRLLDTIPFQKSIKMNMELMCWRTGGTIDYATTSYWYAKDGATVNGQTAPARVKREIGRVAAPPVSQ